MNSTTSRIGSLTINEPPKHLSEFYSFIKNPTISSRNEESSTSNIYKPDSKERRQNSIDTFTSFSPSVLDLNNIVTSKDFKRTIQLNENLLDKAAKLRTSLMEVSNAATEFGNALEDIVNNDPKAYHTKSVSEGLISAGGLQYIIGSNQQILGRIIQESFEDPLQREIKKLQEEYKCHFESYEQEVRVKSLCLREKEIENLKIAKLKTRNLNTYKNNLLNLTSQLEDIDRLKYEYYHDVNSMLENFNQEHLLLKAGSLVRAQLEIYEGIAKKGWSGGGLDDLLSISPDLFETLEDDEKRIDETNIPLPEQVIEEVDSDSEHFSIGPESHISPLQGSPVILYDSSSLADGQKIILEPINKYEALVDDSIDESFSLPVVNNTVSILGQKSKNSEIEGEGFVEDNQISKDNILDELN